MMMRRFHFLPFCAVAACLLLTQSCGNRSASPAGSSTLSRNPLPQSPASGSTFLPTQAPTDFFGKPEEYLDWQAALLLHVADSILSSTPPGLDEPGNRQLAMLLLDAVLHEEGAPRRDAVQRFHLQRTLSALEELENSDVGTGMMIWKLYNMGVVVRTKSVTVAFDLVRGTTSGAEAFVLPDEVMERFADQCDILFISHEHGDHADEVVAGKFLNRGKPVVAPPDLWREKGIYNLITHPEREPHEIRKVRLGEKQMDLDVVLYPGHQGATLQNNVVLVITPEQYLVCHTGDQSREEDFSWMDRVLEMYDIDLLLPNCWTPNPVRTAVGFNPRLVIPLHENELGHSIDHREAYTLDYSRWNLPYNKIIMTWGESFHCE